jgi:hypothetical protein
MIFSTTASPNLNLRPRDGKALLYAYGCVYLATYALSRSPFLKSLIEDFSNWARKEMAEKLKRRLLKVCQYFGSIDPLIKSVKRWFLDGTIPYRWANVTDSTHEGIVEVSLRVEDALLHVPAMDLTKGDMDVLRHKFPAMFQQW